MQRKRSSPLVRKVRHVDPTIGQRLKQMRKARKLTQHQLAMASGLAVKTIMNYEQALALPGIVSAVKLARGLMCDLTDLCFLPLDLSGEDFAALPVSGTGSGKPS